MRRRRRELEEERREEEEERREKGGGRREEHQHLAPPEGRVGQVLPVLNVGQELLQVQVADPSTIFIPIFIQNI